VWRGQLNVPFEYGPNDSEYQLMLVKGVLEQGWWFTNPHLGAPLGQELYDFAVGGDNLHLLLIRLFGLFSSSAATVGNLFYLAAFPLAGAAAFAVLRWAGCSFRSSLVAALLYVLIPYRFLRGEHHAFLAADFGVPLGAYLALGVIEGRELIGRWRSRRTLLTIGACVAVGATGSFYYGTFTILLLVGAGALTAVRTGWRALKVPAICALAILVVFAVDIAPTLIYRAAHGSNPTVGNRLASESELYGFKLAQLLLPVPGERLGPLARLEQRYASTVNVPPYNESFSSSLGLVGSAGFVLLLGAVLIAAAWGAVGSDGARAPPLLGHLARPGALALIAFLVGTVGGVGSLIAYVVTPQIRGWNRISPFIAFLSLLAIARLLDVALAKARPRRLALVGIPLAILALGVFDQTPAAIIPAYGKSAARWSADRAFVRQVDAAMPAGASVFELPYVQFPEGTPIVRMGEYDLLRGYLHDARLRWSFGATNGRPADFAGELSHQPSRLLLPGIAAAGFDGLWLDTAGLRATPAQSIRPLARAVGSAPLTGGQGDLAFFDLRPYAARLNALNGRPAIERARDAVLRPLRITGTVVPGVAGLFDRAATTLAIHNPRTTPTPARITMTAALPAGARLVVETAGTTQTLTSARGQGPIGSQAPRAYQYEASIAVPPGSSRLVLRSPDNPAIVPISVTITDAALLALATPPPAR
jgi:phosphoglycerol transferase